MTNTGKEAEKAFLERIQRAGQTVVERLWDASDLRGLNNGRHINDFKKPSDFIVTQDGNTFYAEVKSVQSATSFPFANLEDGQRSAALRQAAVGGTYRFFLFSYGLGQWFVMEAEVFAAAIAANKSSIKFNNLPRWTTA